MTTKRRRRSLDPDATIVIVDKENTSKGKCGARFDELIRRRPKTVGSFVATIGSVADLRWWESRGRIKLLAPSRQQSAAA
jgi:hypothetical protein